MSSTLNKIVQRTRNLAWKFVELLPEGRRLSFRRFLLHRGLSKFEIEWHKIRDLGPNRGTALDIGANRGLWSIELAQHYNQVIAFEPNTEITKELEKCGIANIKVMHLGLSSAEGESILHLPIDSNDRCLDGWASLSANNLTECQKISERIVSIRPLDSIGLTDVTFIKLDVEGHEIEVIKGGMKLLSRDRPIVLAEIRTANLAEFSSLMNEVGLFLLPSKGSRSEDMFLFGPYD